MHFGRAQLGLWKAATYGQLRKSTADAWQVSQEELSRSTTLIVLFTSVSTAREKKSFQDAIKVKIRRLSHP